ncbi:hypothetical protein JCM8547_006414 [Rhodosporidiobolus lusitaniae]
MGDLGDLFPHPFPRLTSLTCFISYSTCTRTPFIDAPALQDITFGIHYPAADIPFPAFPPSIPVLAFDFLPESHLPALQSLCEIFSHLRRVILDRIVVNDFPRQAVKHLAEVAAERGIELLGNCLYGLEVATSRDLDYDPDAPDSGAQSLECEGEGEDKDEDMEEERDGEDGEDGEDYEDDWDAEEEPLYRQHWSDKKKRETDISRALASLSILRPYFDSQAAHEEFVAETWRRAEERTRDGRAE